MKVSVFILFALLSNHLAFAICDEEIAKRDRAKQLFESWGKTSEVGAGVVAVAAGCVAGFLTANPIIVIAAGAAGGVLGGGAPGGVCLRMEALYKYREEVLRVCQENSKNEELQKVEEKNRQILEANSQTIGGILTRFFVKKLDEYQVIANTEINTKINEYVDDPSKDISDPLVQEELQAEIDAITHKYF
jgi:hypothetical protein